MLEAVCVLAVWRLTSLLHYEDGPFSLFSNFKRRMRNNQIGDMLDCFLCTSIWVALPFSFLFSYWFIMIFTLSAGAILIDAIHERLLD